MYTYDLAAFKTITYQEWSVRYFVAINGTKSKKMQKDFPVALSF